MIRKSIKSSKLIAGNMIVIIAIRNVESHISTILHVFVEFVPNQNQKLVGNDGIVVINGKLVGSTVFYNPQ